MVWKMPNSDEAVLRDESIRLSDNSRNRCEAWLTSLYANSPPTVQDHPARDVTAGKDNRDDI